MNSGARFRFARLFCVFGISSAVLAPPARAQNFVWARHLGGTGHDDATDVAVDPSGNVYSVGRFFATADFDPGPGTFNMTSIDFIDAYVSKLDNGGNFVWAKQQGGMFSQYALAVHVDGSGNSYSVGYFQATTDFDPGPGTFNLTPLGTDVFIVKLNTAGNLVWARQLGGTGFDVGRDVTVDASGNVFTVGEFEGTADFDPGPGTFNMTSAGNADAFISELDGSGNFVWARRVGGISREVPHGVKVAAGNIYVAGEFQGSADFDPGAGTFNLTPAGGIDGFICKLDGSGNFVWAKKLGGASTDLSWNLAVAGGDVYTVGQFQGTVDFDPGPAIFNLTSAGGGDAFVLKLDSAGNFIWAERVGGTMNDSSSCLAVAPTGNVYVGGRFEGTADFDPGPAAFNLTSLGQGDAFLAKLDKAGKFMSAMKMGGTDDDGALGLTVASDVYVAGYFRATVDFDPGPGTFNMTSEGLFDAFIEKLGSAGGAGAVADGHFVGGVPLTVAKAGGLLELSWGGSCRSLDGDYEVYRGVLGNFTSHVPILCSTSGATSTTVSPLTNDQYYLVVPATATNEGSYGKNSAGVERPPSASACRPQLLGACP